ncbi:HAD family hydrolase [Roseateles amylovorans]|uniref:HAD family phosphatase n=1 Tax=Roseateles amylovorans TaxID=2978473 RepID=A0ABY6AX07_9BURK|nr:HAD family phosphatase [Roseateles amylovorans]UXH77711.1 HAD family phosphatase [Roseateles amylovorans]
MTDRFGGTGAGVGMGMDASGTAAAASRRYRAAVFDMDGLLLDSERPIRDAWLAHAAELGLSFTPEQYLLTVGRNRQDCLALMTPHFGSLSAAEAAYEAVDRRLADSIGERGFAPMPGVPELLSALKARGVPLALASSTRHEKVVHRLKTAGLLEFFDAVHGGDQVARGKPFPDLFELAARSLKQAPVDCLAFEDSSYGAQAALSAGMGVVLVPDLKAPDPEVAPHCLVLTTLRQALPLLTNWYSH